MRVLPDEGLYFAIGAEILAIVFGLLSWRARLSKVAVTGALILFTLGTVNYIRFMSDSRADEEHRRFEQRELQIPGGMKR